MKFKFGYANEDEWREDVEIFNLIELKNLHSIERYIVKFYPSKYSKNCGYDGEIIVYNGYIE